MNPSKVKKVLLISILSCALAVGGGYGAYRAYTSVRQVRLVKKARDYIAKSKERNAVLCLQRALRYNPKDVEACRLMARLYEAARAPAALVLRSRIVEVNPHSLDDRLALVQTALAFKDYASATNALEAMDAAGKKSAAYHNVAGAVASTLGQLTEAEAHFAEAARLEPTNPAPRLNLAVVRLHGTNDAILAEARSSIRQIVSNPADTSLRCAALRDLILDAVRFKQADTALALSKDLVQDTNSAFSDRLLRLNVLGTTTNAEFKSTLEAFQRDAATNAAHVYELGAWQMTSISPASTLSWLQTLPMQIQTNQPVTMLVADCKSLVRDWKGLQQWLTGQNWAETEFLRHALLSRAYREENMDAGAKGEWELALKLASNQKGTAIMLLRMAAQWKWQSEVEELLWTVVERYPDEKWASPALMKSLYVGGRTRSLMKLCGQELKRAPSNPSLKNNLAVTALLLDAQELRPHDLAQQIYEKSPTNASFASTYAFSLYLRKKNQEALKVIETLAPKDLEKQSIAGYYALILKATGNNQKAATYFDYAFKGPMLPEEKKLFQSARTGA
jgi:tetratricopeptide (TPR) repeat protein